MPTIDVRANLDAPSTTAAATTLRIDELSEHLEKLGGGVLFFSAGDPYHIKDLQSLGRLRYADFYHQGGIRLRANVSMVGEPGTTLVWEGGGNGCMIASDMPFGLDDETGDISCQITSDVAAGDSKFKVDSVSAFAVGDTVMLRLDQQPLDAREAKWWTFATVVAKGTVSGNHFLTLSRPAQIPVMYADQFYVIPDPMNQGVWHAAASTDPGALRNPRSLWIRRVPFLAGTTRPMIPDGVTIDGFELRGSTSSPPQGGIWLQFCRNVTVRNVSGENMGAGLLTVQYSQHVSGSNFYLRGATYDNIDTYSYLAQGMNFGAVQGCRFDDIRLERFQSTGINTEAACIQLRLGNVTIVDSHPLRLTIEDNRFILFTQSDSELFIDGLTIEGYGESQLIGSGAEFWARINRTVITDLQLRLVPEFTNERHDWNLTPTDADVAVRADPFLADMRSTRGVTRRHRTKDGETVYQVRHAPARLWGRSFDVPSGVHTVSAPATIQLPDGILRRGRLRVGNLTNVTAVYLVNQKATGEDKLNLLERHDPVTGIVGAYPGLAQGDTIEFRSDATWLGDNEFNPLISKGFAEQNISFASGLPYPRELWVVTTSGFTGTEFRIHLEYLPIEDPSGSRDDEDRGWIQLQP